MNEIRTIPVFAYGSLRPGANGASTMLTRASVAGPWRALTLGELFYHECGAYPVLAPSTTTVTRGDLLLVDERSQGWQWLLDMEIRAGYEPRWVSVTAEQSDGKMGTTEALAFMWEHSTDGLERVPGGDWMNADWEPWPMRD